MDPADVVVPSGYQVEAVASGLTFPTAVTFDGDGRPVVDFGVMTMGPEGPQPRPQTGVLWRISRTARGAWR